MTGAATVPTGNRTYNMEFLFTDWLGTPVWFWMAFLGLVVALTAFDLGILHKEDKEMGIGESLKLSAFYISIALAFGIFVYFQKTADYGAVIGAQRTMEYYTGFFIEKALSIDNIFVIGLIFTAFAIPPKYQYRALLWGIIGVIVLRGIMIGLGAAVVQEYEWVLYLFAAFLIATGIKMMFADDKPMDVKNNAGVKLLSRIMRVTPELHQQKFFARIPDSKTGKMVLAATPLFLALVVINIADLIFAVDSVPAIFAITTDTFIVYTSNIMAILGLRALYFALAAMVHRFHYLKYALAAVLVFIGSKIFVADFILGGDKFPPVLSLGITFALILGGIFWSLWKTRGEAAIPPPAP
jgi:tellurite resistance protein TerC